jgi:hypothetical protein
MTRDDAYVKAEFILYSTEATLALKFRMWQKLREAIADALIEADREKSC